MSSLARKIRLVLVSPCVTPSRVSLSPSVFVETQLHQRVMRIAGTAVAARK